MKRFQFSSSKVKIDHELEEQLRISIQGLMKEESILQCNDENFKVDDISPLFEPLNIYIDQKESSILLNITSNQFWTINIGLSGTITTIDKYDNNKIKTKAITQNWVINLSFIELSNDGNYEVINHDFKLIRRLPN